MERKGKDNEILEKVMERIKKDKMNYIEDNRIKENILDIIKTKKIFYDVKKIRDNIEETERRINELTLIESRIINTIKNEYDVIKNPIEEIEQDLSKRKDVLTKEISVLVDMKKLLDKDTDKELIDEIEKMKVERLRNKRIIIDLLDILLNKNE
jgi:hypothetical protein